MNYLVQFNLTKAKKDENLKGVIGEESMPLTYKATDVKSKEEALKKAQSAFSSFYLGDNNPQNSYSIDIANIKELPEEIEVLKTNYYEYYKNMLLDMESQMQGKDQIELVGKKGRKYFVKRKNSGEKNIEISDGFCTLEFYEDDEFNHNVVAFSCNPYTDKRASISVGYGAFDYDKTTYNKSIEDEMEGAYYYNPDLYNYTSNFFETIPMFSKKEIDKKQAQVQKEYEEEFRKKHPVNQGLAKDDDEDAR